MKRLVHATGPEDVKDMKSYKLGLDSVPDIDNQPLSVDVVVSWLDRLIEVKNNEETTSNNWFLLEC